VAFWCEPERGKKIQNSDILFWIHLIIPYQYSQCFFLAIFLAILWILVELRLLNHRILLGALHPKEKGSRSRMPWPPDQQWRIYGHNRPTGTLLYPSWRTDMMIGLRMLCYRRRLRIGRHTKCKHDRHVYLNKLSVTEWPRTHITVQEIKYGYRNSIGSGRNSKNSLKRNWRQRLVGRENLFEFDKTEIHFGFRWAKRVLYDCLQRSQLETTWASSK
jgi:hypothetical protein